MSQLKKKLVLGLVSTILSLALLELCVFLISESGWIPLSKPSYKVPTEADYAPTPTFWADINKDFGVWHIPHSEYRKSHGYGDVNYVANSYGARDIERDKDSNHKRVVVLGDSFIEGYGLEEKNRLTNVLEQKTGIEHLNFGSSGFVGPLQYYLMYKTLASQFSHSAVLVAILPKNDFEDDDYEFGKQVHFDRYRPYLVGTYPDYSLVYYQDSLSASAWSVEQRNLRTRISPIDKVKIFLRNFSYTYDALVYIRDARRYTQVQHRFQSPEEGKAFSGYYDFTEEQFNILRYCLERIATEAKGKAICFMTQPVLGDIQRYENDRNPLLPGKMKQLCDSLGVTYVDLLPSMHASTREWETLFLPGNGHPSEYGSIVGRDILLRDWSIYLQR